MGKYQELRTIDASCYINYLILENASEAYISRQWNSFSRLISTELSPRDFQIFALGEPGEDGWIYVRCPEDLDLDQLHHFAVWLDDPQKPGHPERLFIAGCFDGKSRQSYLAVKDPGGPRRTLGMFENGECFLFPLEKAFTFEVEMLPEKRLALDWEAFPWDGIYGGEYHPMKGRPTNRRAAWPPFPTVSPRFCPPGVSVRTFFEGSAGTRDEKAAGDESQTERFQSEVKLNLSALEIESFDELHCEETLTYLNAEGGFISGAETLRRFTGMKTLNLRDMGLTDISFVEPMKELKQLLVGFNRISDLSPLSGLKKLEYLYIAGNPIRDFSVLWKLPALASLYADPEQVPDEQARKRLPPWTAVRVVRRKLVQSGEYTDSGYVFDRICEYPQETRTGSAG